MTDFSIEAQVVAGAFWGRLMPCTALSFERPWIIHPKTRKGLDELVEAGLLTMERFNKISDKLIWKPTSRMEAEGPKPSIAFMKGNGFPVTTENNS